MSSQATIAADFQHEPLVDPQTHIRLLRITEGSLGQRVSCTLTTWPLEMAPSYTAISYTWGHPSNTSTILIDGKQKIVRRNCEYILHQAWAFNADSLFWVDDICIDQSLTEEKNHQVSMMGDLYKKATRILACVGEHGDDSDFLISILESRKPFFTQLSEGIYTHEDESTLEWTGNVPSLRKAPRFFDGLVRTSLFKNRGRISQAYGQFLKRPYFSRVWVLQELFSGNGRITLCCGMDHQPLMNFLALSLLVGHWIVWPGIFGNVVDHVLGILPDSSSRTLHMSIKPQASSLYWETKAQRGSLSAGAAPDMRPTNLPRLLPFMADFQCEDPRDKIYGIRSLIDWRGHAAPFPDYSKDVFGLAVEITGIIHTQLRWQLVHNGWAERSMLMLAGHLREMLSLSNEQPLLQEAIRLRRGPTPGQIQPRRLPEQHPQPRQGDILWWGSRLGDYNKLKHCGTYVEIRGRRNKIVGFAPQDTQPGDWFLTCEDEVSSMGNSSWFWEYRRFAKQYIHSPGLILRVAPDGQCSIIGPIFRPIGYRKPAKLPDPKFFVFWWDPEDLLVLEWRYSQYDCFNEVAAQADNCFGLRVSINPDSTLVKGPFHPEDIRKELKKDPTQVFLESDFNG
jgi:hypothetical protein